VSEGTATTLVFSHANGFPASTYGVLFDAWRAAGIEVLALEKFGHDPRFAISSNWPQLRQQLIEFVEREAAGPVFFVGHSLGGYLSLMAACTRPDLARGLVLLDAPVLGGWRAHSVHMAKLSGLMRRISPGRVAERRRHEWPSAEAMHAHFARKAAFARWHPKVLADYVAHGGEAFEGGHRLAFSREVEARIYNTLPHHFDTLLARHPLRCPAAFIGGTRSAEVRQVGLEATRRLTHGRMTWIEGGHLFPFEKPEETAAAVLEWLGEWASAP
jgi:pimeloyl-ACP methyl ester carboxylesterase